MILSLLYLFGLLYGLRMHSLNYKILILAYHTMVDDLIESFVSQNPVQRLLSIIVVLVMHVVDYCEPHHGQLHLFVHGVPHTVVVILS